LSDASKLLAQREVNAQNADGINEKVAQTTAADNGNSVTVAEESSAITATGNVEQNGFPNRCNCFELPQYQKMR
jgi:hypothetical protein